MNGNISTNVRAMVVFALLLVMGISIVFEANRDSLALAKGMTDFNTMTSADFIEGRFVQGTIYELDDEFAYLEEYNSTFGIKHNERVTAHYYVMPLPATYDSETPQYAAVCLKNAGMITTAEKMIQETWDYWDYGTEPDVWTELPITGKISKLDGELLDYFYEWLMYGDEGATREDYAGYVCPYIITYYEPSSSSSLLVMGIVLLVAGIAGLAVTITLTVKAKHSAAEGGAAMGIPSYPVESGYTPVSSAQTTTSSPAEMEDFMRAMANLKQPEDNADEFFGTAKKSAAEEKQPEVTAPPAADGTYSDMDSIDTSGLGIGIGDDD